MDGYYLGQSVWMDSDRLMYVHGT